MQNSSMQWEDLRLTRQFVNALVDLGHVRPLEIQIKAIPPILAGQQIVGISQTGTGKTAAFLLPLLSILKFNSPGPRCLVLVPTKELVIQIAGLARSLAKYTDLKIVGLFGGVGPKLQLEELKDGSDMIVSTPGRFLEMYQSQQLKTKMIKHLVIDEADRMMDMNFMPQLRRIFEVIAPKRQNLLFSATFPGRVHKLVEEFIDFHVKIEIYPQSTTPSSVRQRLYKVPNFKTKLNLLAELLVDEKMDRIMVFARTKEVVTNLMRYLDRSEVGRVRAIHSNKAQNTRINTLEEFRKGNLRLLITTDVTARGIDVKKVSHVINFDVPVVYDDYVHRIGRTGRAFETGEAISFVTPDDEYHIAKIEKIINQKIQVVELPENVKVEETDFFERQKIARELDRQKRKEDPTFKGAFHSRKR